MAERNGSALRRRLRSAERLSERAIARGSFKENTPAFQIESIARIGHALRPAPGLFPWDARLFACSCWHISKTIGFEQIADTSANGQQPARMAQHRIPS